MRYVDGFVAAVPNANRDAYQAHAASMAALFREGVYPLSIRMVT
jgi:uncharacterized protein YbaA (DUF1428 family)